MQLHVKVHQPRSKLLGNIAKTYRQEMLLNV